MKLFYPNFRFEPAAGPAAGGGGGGGATMMDADVMSDVFGRLGLPAELMGETAAKPAEKAAPAKPAVKAVAKPAAAVEEPAEETPAEENTEETPAEAEEETPAEGAEGEAEVAAVEFSPEQQAVVEEAKTGFETRIAELTAQHEAAVAEVASLKAQIGTTPKAVAEVHPLFMVEDPGQLAQREQSLRSFEDWALKNWDGTDASEDGKVPAYTAAQVRARYSEVKREREEIIPQARQNFEYRRQWDEVVKKTYPDLFKPNHAYAKVLDDVLRIAPGLKAVFPNIKMMIGDALVGEKLRLDKAKAAKANGGKAPVKAAPKLPGKPAAAGRTALATKPKTGNPINAQRFAELGGDRDALMQMIMSSDLVN